MELTSTRTMDITKLALDGLLARQQAITANAANVVTPNYSRKEVSFEGQLREIVEKDDIKNYIKQQNSIEYTPTSLDEAMGRTKSELTPQQAKYLQSNIYSKYEPQTVDDIVSPADSTGNNVELEKEVMDMANTGLKYNTLSRLENKTVKLISSAIKGDVVF